MTTTRQALVLLALLCLCTLGPAAQAQQPIGESAQAVSRVGFVVDDSLDTASPNDTFRAAGVTRMANIFQSLGFETVTLDLDSPIDPTVEVVVVIRPQRPITLREATYIFAHLQRGHNLLLAVDPNLVNDVRAENSRTVFNELLQVIYGASFEDNLMVEPWFTSDTLRLGGLRRGQTLVRPDDVPVHPIMLPLVQHDIPVVMWHSRSIDMEPIGPSTFGTSLAYTETMYGETETTRQRNAFPYSLAYNIGDDTIGRIPLASVAVDTTTGSRIVLLGDSEMIQNGYGLQFNNQTDQPAYLGNFIMAERLAAWLVEDPIFTWPGLPSGYTWIAPDGLSSEWDALGLPIVSDLALDSAIGVPDLVGGRATFNDHYFYAMANTSTPVLGGGALVLRTESVTLSVTQDALGRPLMVRNGVPVDAPDVGFGVGVDGLEVRIPLRFMPPPTTAIDICAAAAVAAATSDCLGMPLFPEALPTVDPSPQRITGVPLGVIETPSFINMRSGPGTNFSILTTLPDETLLAIRGRTGGGQWLRVDYGAHAGWVFADLVTTAVERDTLPIVEP